MIASGEQQRISYFKRYRMEIDLYDPPPPAALPDGYNLVPWQEDLVERHAEVLYYSFCGEIDAKVFPSLGNRQGCSSLMREIYRKPGFLPEATWLVACGPDVCGTIQGIRERPGLGAIQNIGVTWSHRRKGLATALLLQALHGFRMAGLGRALLEATAQNDSAVQLYWRLGFRRTKTIYKAVQVAPCP
jgi:ribosomal protein S18 acetylase RimI-like enzyme